MFSVIEPPSQPDIPACQSLFGPIPLLRLAHHACVRLIVLLGNTKVTPTENQFLKNYKKKC
jgi:hypothetical protein